MSIKGSIEILKPDGSNIGVAGQALTAESVPMVVAVLYGITGLEDKEPEERASRMPVAEWTGTDVQEQPVTVVLWEEPEFSASEIGQAMVAAAIAAQQEGI